MEELPVPEAGAGEVVVRVEAAGLNYIDIYKRLGLYRVALPATPGEEGAGAVAQLGSGVAGLQVGDRVAWVNVPGAYAEYAVVAADRLVMLPEGVATREGAAVMLQGMTAHYLTHSTCALEPGDTCLIHAAAGGVGLLLCQMAKMRGARVIGTTGSAEKAALAREAGADDVILYREQDFEAETQRLTGGRGVRVVYDSVGRSTFEASLRCLARRGLMVLYGQSSGPVAPVDPQVLNQRGSLYLTRPTLAHYTVTRAELLERANAVLAWVRDGRLRVRVDREFALSEAAEAHRALESRRTAGKLLLIP
jgi:NADPH2:quinone reductase